MSAMTKAGRPPRPGCKAGFGLSLWRGGRRIFPESGSELGEGCAEGVKNWVGGGLGGSCC